MVLGRRIYYFKSSGEVILDSGEKIGNIKYISPEEEVKIFKVFDGINANSYDYLELDFGQHSKEFLEASSYSVDTKNKKILFDFSEVEYPENISEDSLAQKVADNTDYLIELDFRLLMIELNLN